MAKLNLFDKAQDVANSVLSNLFDGSTAQQAAIDCVHDQAYADAYQAGKVHFEDAAAGQPHVEHWQPAPEQAMQDCGIPDVPLGPTPSFPSLSNPVLAFSEIAFTPSPTNMPEVLQEKADQAFNSGSTQGYHDGRVEAFDERLEQHFQTNWDHPPSEPSIFEPQATTTFGNASILPSWTVPSQQHDPAAAQQNHQFDHPGTGALTSAPAHGAPDQDSDGGGGGHGGGSGHSDGADGGP